MAIEKPWAIDIDVSVPCGMEKALTFATRNAYAEKIPA